MMALFSPQLSMAYTWLQRHPTYCVPIVVLFTTDMCSCMHTDTQCRWIVSTTKREDTCKEKDGGFDFVVFKNKSVGVVYLERFFHFFYSTVFTLQM